MIDCLSIIEGAAKDLVNCGHLVDTGKYKLIKDICNEISMLRGIDIDTVVVCVSELNHSISIKLSTYLFEIDDMNHEVFDILKQCDSFSFYVGGKETHNPMIIIEFVFDGFWER